MPNAVNALLPGEARMVSLVGWLKVGRHCHLPGMTSGSPHASCMHGQSRRCITPTQRAIIFTWMSVTGKNELSVEGTDMLNLMSLFKHARMPA